MALEYIPFMNVPVDGGLPDLVDAYAQVYAEAGEQRPVQYVNGRMTRNGGGRVPLSILPLPGAIPYAAGGQGDGAQNLFTAVLQSNEQVAHTDYPFAPIFVPNLGLNVENDMYGRLMEGPFPNDTLRTFAREALEGIDIIAANNSAVALLLAEPNRPQVPLNALWRNVNRNAWGQDAPTGTFNVRASEANIELAATNVVRGSAEGTVIGGANGAAADAHIEGGNEVWLRYNRPPFGWRGELRLVSLKNMRGNVAEFARATRRTSGGAVPRPMIGKTVRGMYTLLSSYTRVRRHFFQLMRGNPAVGWGLRFGAAPPPQPRLRSGVQQHNAQVAAHAANDNGTLTVILRHLLEQLDAAEAYVVGGGPFPLNGVINADEPAVLLKFFSIHIRCRYGNGEVIGELIAPSQAAPVERSFWTAMQPVALVRTLQQKNAFVAAMMAEIAGAVNSGEAVVIDNNTVFEVTVVTAGDDAASRGRAWRGAGTRPFDRENCSRSVVEGKGAAMCAAKSLILLGEFNARGVGALRKLDGSLELEARALELHRLAGVTVRRDGVAFEDLDAFAAVLGVQVLVVTPASVHAREFVYETAEVEGEGAVRLVLLYDGRPGAAVGHFSGVMRLNSIFSVDSYCLRCRVCVKRDHRCGEVCCKVCRSYNCDGKPGSWTWCADCNRTLLSVGCYEEHKRNKTCERVSKCSKCEVTLNSAAARKRHTCGTTCSVCGAEDVNKRHRCTVSAMEPREVACERYIVFDYETTQYLGPHVVNYAVAMYTDAEDVHTFTTNGAFCRWLFDTGAHKGVTAIAHNGRGYDFQFVREWLIRHQRKYDVISNGNKIMLLTEKRSGVRLIDSLSFLPMPLDAFTRTFGLDDRTLKKGFFPHFFNTPKNVATYVGAIPPLKYFGPGNMGAAKRAELVRWHATRVAEGGEYHFARELHEYCVSDVRLLRAGVTALRTLFLQVTGVDPWQQITIAGTAMTVYRTNFVPEGVCVMRDAGMFGASLAAQRRDEWVRYVCEVRGWKPARYERSSCDVVVECHTQRGELGGVLVYYYDYFHGNAARFPPAKWNSMRRMSMGRVGQVRAEAMQALVSAHGAERVITIWNSEWCQERKMGDVREVLGRVGVQRAVRLQPRDAFFGGRVNPTKLKYTFGEGEWGVYADICSLYPSVNYYDPYPVGLPKMWRNTPFGWFRLDAHGNEEAREEPPPLQDLFGFIACEVACPTHLYHPLLPSRGVDGKLHFDLLSPKHGTWTTVEVQRAVSLGYTVTHTSEVWHYERSHSLFREYVKTFVKLKQEASGWPAGVAGDARREQEYMDKFKAHMGFELDREKIQSNPGLRAVAKLCLNSLWGKFGERDMPNTTKVVYGNRQLTHLITDPALEVRRVVPLSEAATEVTYAMYEEVCESASRMSGNKNVAIAAFTTSHARLRHYAALELLGEQVLYYDTDSVIYVAREGGRSLPLGEYLGEWTDELGGERITGTFLSTGPKSYSYQVRGAADGRLRTVTKIKGFTLNSRNAALIDHAAMGRIVEGLGAVAVETCNPSRIRITRTGEATISSVRETKLLSFTYSTRHVCVPDAAGNIDTHPHGYSPPGGDVQYAVPWTEAPTEVYSAEPEEGVEWSAADGDSGEPGVPASPLSVLAEEEVEEEEEERERPRRRKVRGSRGGVAAYIDDEASASEDDECSSIGSLTPSELAEEADFIDGGEDRQHASLAADYGMYLRSL